MSAEWRVNHEHNGVEVEFPGKPSAQIIASLKQNGFRWAPSTKVWYAKDYPHRRTFLDTIATRGEDVAASGKSFAEKIEEKQERAEARQERYTEYAAGAAKEAQQRFNTAFKIIDAIPMGQPILVGHHSERRHRADLERHDTNMRKGIEAERRAEYHQERAGSAGAQLEGYDRPDFLQRRINDCEAEIRRFQRSRAEWEGREDWRTKYPGEGARYDRLIAEVQSKLDFCRERLAEVGGVTYGRHNVHVGDFIMGRFGPAIVRRVNPKTVSVHWLNPVLRSRWTSPCEYGRIKDCKTRAEMRAWLNLKLEEFPGGLPSELAGLVAEVGTEEVPTNG